MKAQAFVLRIINIISAQSLQKHYVDNLKRKYMQNVKKYVGLLFVAIMGGLISVGAYKTIEQKQYFAYDNYSNARKANYDIRNVTVPTFDFADVSEAVMPTVVHIKTITNPKQNE